MESDTVSRFLIFLLGIAAMFIALPLAGIALFMRSMGSDLNIFSQVFYIPALAILGAFLTGAYMVGRRPRPRQR
jgi:hypothetical protein